MREPVLGERNRPQLTSFIQQANLDAAVPFGVKGAQASQSMEPVSPNGHVQIDQAEQF